MEAKCLCVVFLLQPDNLHVHILHLWDPHHAASGLRQFVEQVHYQSFPHPEQFLQDRGTQLSLQLLPSHYDSYNVGAGLFIWTMDAHCYRLYLPQCSEYAAEDFH